jgi:hypothetical protein
MSSLCWNTLEEWPVVQVGISFVSRLVRDKAPHHHGQRFVGGDTHLTEVQRDNLKSWSALADGSVELPEEVFNESTLDASIASMGLALLQIAVQNGIVQPHEVDDLKFGEGFRVGKEEGVESTCHCLGMEGAGEMCVPCCEGLDTCVRWVLSCQQ